MYTIHSVVACCCFGLFCLISNSFGLSNFTNYQYVIRINDIVASSGKMWAASSGGLFCIDFDKQTQTLFTDGYCFPDLNCTALDFDSKGNLWIGTKLGYLYKRSSNGNCSVYDSYLGSKWDITDIHAYKDYIIVASSKGCSVFDPKKGLAIRNATATDTSGDPAVYAIAVHNDSLYVGGNKSYNAVDISGSRLLNIDKSTWTSTSTGKPIVCFVDSGGKLLPRDAPAAIAGSVLFHCVNSTNATYIYADTARKDTVYDKITKMLVDDKQNLWFGTEQNFFFCRNADGFIQYKLPGLTFNSIIRVHAARNGVVWLLSSVSDQTWWEGINSFDGKTWQLYNRFTIPDFGMFAGGGSNLHGICEDIYGNIWIGTPGSNVKFYDAQNNQWSRYYTAGYIGFDTTVRKFTPNEANSWGRVDAIAQDSSGYMWFSNNDPIALIKSGPLVCYDASNRQSPNYRRFFPMGNEYYAKNITSICIDSSGKILAGTDDGRLLIVRHDGNPIADGVTVEIDKNDMDVIDICSAPNGAAWIATGKGLYRYQRSDGSLALNSAVQTAVTCVEAENERILWLGTSSAGLIRYDVAKDAQTTVDMGSGLVSNAVKDLSIDKRGGYLWVGTTDGVSRYYLGHSDVPVAGNASIIAYPNPFSRSNPNHRMIVFKHCAPEAQVLIYAMNGTLVKQLSRGNNSLNPVDDNAFESTLFWVPPKKLAPGAYYFVGNPQKPVATKKLLIVP